MRARGGLPADQGGRGSAFPRIDRMILTVCLSPSIDVTVEVDALEVGKTNIARRKRRRPGGKALNVALGVARLGGDALVTGFMYRENAETFEELLDRGGVKHSFIMTEGRVRENYKFIDHRSMLTEVNDVGAEVPAENLEKLLERVRRLSAVSRVTVISGGLPRGVDASYYGDLFRAVAPGSLRVADATGGKLNAAVSAGVDLVKPNLGELENCIGREMTCRQDMLDACRELVRRGAKTVLLSLGKEGAILTDGKENYYCRSTSVAVNSTVGAGDAMVAAAAMKMAEGAPMPEILRAGTAAGTAAVTTFDEIAFPREKYQEILESLQVKRLF